MGRHVRAGSFDVWTEQVGAGPDVLLIGGAGDTVESWQFQLDGLADRYRLTPRGGDPGGDHTDVIPWTCGRRTVVRPT